MAQEGNNHFAIPCASDWSGSKGMYQGKCYRHYDNAWSSFRDHSTYLTSGRFPVLEKLDKQDFRAWAEGLEETGYSKSSRHLARSLIEVIENHQLYDLDSK